METGFVRSRSTSPMRLPRGKRSTSRSMPLAASMCWLTTPVMAHTTPFEQMTTQDFRYQVETNLFGVVNLTRAVLPVMREQHAGSVCFAWNRLFNRLRI